jgi:hypothetical protein
MTSDREELLELFEALCDGAISPAQHQKLQSRLAIDSAAQRLYFDYLDLRLHLRQWQRASLGEQTLSNPDEPNAISSGSVVIQTSPILHVPYSTPYAQFGGFAFSYVVATLIVGIGLLIGWACQVTIPQSAPQEIADISPRPSVEPSHSNPKSVFVGQITGMYECHWADPHTAPIGFDRIALGRKYVLTSGLLEIAYDTGARVILQGPCTYEVESTTGGFLTLGRLTARVGERGIRNPPSPLPPLPAPLFAVRTPTAVVTDLGTEFGVEVDKSGDSKAQVFRGRVEMQAVDAPRVAKAVTLGENESARVEAGQGQVAKVVRGTSWPNTFVRQMPRRVNIKLLGTGVNIKPGDDDPHWQLVARSDDPKFKPRPAVVISLKDSRYLENQPSRSQWISVAKNPTMPDDVVYTFRTTFDLTDLRPQTAVLHGRFAVDNHVEAIRLNGRQLHIIRHGHEEFGLLHAFSTERGFVEGVNVLEIDVKNGDPDDISPASAVLLLVELEGSALTASPQPSAGSISAKNEQSKN